MKSKIEKDIAYKIYNSILEYLNKRKISVRELANLLKIPYTTLFTWLETLKKGKCISIKNILFLEEKLNIKLIFFNQFIRLKRLKYIIKIFFYKTV